MRNVSSFLSVLTFILTFGTLAHADSMGIDFTSMPKNLKMQYSNSEGGGWIEIYKGRRSGHYMVEVYSLGGERRYRAYYGDDGKLRYREYANGNVRTFSPSHCQRVIGKCSFAFTNSQGQDGNGTANLRKRGKGFTYSWKTNGKTRKFSYVLGQYNLMVSGRTAEGSKFKLEKMSVGN